MVSISVTNVGRSAAFGEECSRVAFTAHSKAIVERHVRQKIARAIGGAVQRLRDAFVCCRIEWAVVCQLLFDDCQIALVCCLVCVRA